MPTLFELVVERSGLPRVVARASVRRALARAGVKAEELDGLGLKLALPALEETLRVYLEPEEVAARMIALRALTKGGT